MPEQAVFVPASFWRRFGARTIDFFVCMALTFVAVIPLVIVALVLYPIIGEDKATSLAAFLAFVIAYVAIEYYLLRRRGGQTLGKGLLGLRVLDVNDPNGSKPITNRAALARMAVFIGPFIAYCAAFYITYDPDLGDSTGGLDTFFVGLWMLMLTVSAVTAVADRAKRRALHDFAAGTRVVRAQARPVSLGQDLKMLVPGRVDMTKYPAPAPPVTMTKLPQGQPTPQDYPPPPVDFGKRG
jgi:uncharacterized RDD family membrane protein YckC